MASASGGENHSGTEWQGYFHRRVVHTLSYRIVRKQTGITQIKIELLFYQWTFPTASVSL